MSSSTQGKLYVIAAPSGAGKTSLVKALTQDDSQLQISISHTTRPMRPAEVDGKDYFFIDEQTFRQMVSRDAFLEHATVYGCHYGTSAEWVQHQLEAGIDVILEIDWQGARQVKNLFQSAVLIFILPPSLEALRERLKKREQDDLATIEKRMALAQNEIQHATEFDYLIVNDQFDAALAQLRQIVLANRTGEFVQIDKQPGLLASLLKKQ